MSDKLKHRLSVALVLFSVVMLGVYFWRIWLPEKRVELTYKRLLEAKIIDKSYQGMLAGEPEAFFKNMDGVPLYPWETDPETEQLISRYRKQAQAIHVAARKAIEEGESSMFQGADTLGFSLEELRKSSELYRESYDYLAFKKLLLGKNSSLANPSLLEASSDGFMLEQLHILCLIRQGQFEEADRCLADTLDLIVSMEAHGFSVYMSCYYRLVTCSTLLLNQDVVTHLPKVQSKLKSDEWMHANMELDHFLSSVVSEKLKDGLFTFCFLKYAPSSDYYFRNKAKKAPFGLYFYPGISSWVTGLARYQCLFVERKEMADALVESMQDYEQAYVILSELNPDSNFILPGSDKSQDTLKPEEVRNSLKELSDLNSDHPLLSKSLDSYRYAFWSLAFSRLVSEELLRLHEE